MATLSVIADVSKEEYCALLQFSVVQMEIINQLRALNALPTRKTDITF